VPKDQHLSPEAEYERYLLHENHADDPRYREFFSEFFTKLCDLAPKTARVLDFGCGADSALVAMLRERGHPVSEYDLFFKNDKTALQETYDIVTATEVLEHLRDPTATVREILNLTKPGGIVGTMTKLVQEDTVLDKWHYTLDPTHICFWSSETFEWLAEALNLKLLHVSSKFQLLELPNAGDA